MESEFVHLKSVNMWPDVYRFKNQFLVAGRLLFLVFDDLSDIEREPESVQGQGYSPG